MKGSESVMKINNALISSVVALFLAACGGADQATEKQPNNTAASPAQSNKPIVKVAIDPNYPPFSLHGPDGLSGFDVDMLKAIAEKSGFEVTFSPYPWDILLAQLNSGQADIATGGITITDERKTQMDFSEPYNEISIALLTHSGSGIQNFEQARGKKIAYKAETTAETALRKLLNGTEPDTSLGTETAWKAVQYALPSSEGGGKADAVIGDSTLFEYYAKQYADKDVKVIYNPTATKELNAFVVKKGNNELLSKLNKGLAEIKADGTYDKIRNKWLNTSKSQ